MFSFPERITACLSRGNLVALRGKAKASGFTLIELLVAIAVLALMTVLLAQMLQSTSQSWLGGQARVNNFTKARSMLDLLARDIQSGVFRKDLGLFAGAQAGQPLTNVAFYTQRPGVVTGSGAQVRGVSLVQYTMDSSSMLKRGDLPILWDGAATDISFGSTNSLPGLVSVTSRETVPGVVGFRVLFLQKDGYLSSTYDPANPAKGVAIGLAVIDDNTLRKLADSGKLTALQTALNSQVSGTNSVKADWDRYLQSGMPWENYPSDLGRGLKIFERYVLFP